MSSKLTQIEPQKMTMDRLTAASNTPPNIMNNLS